MSSKAEPTSHTEALKSSAIIGGSTVIVLFIRMIRTKAVAVILGPVGVGLEAIFESVTSLTKTAVDLGISSSGVRQIAAATGSGDETVIAKTAFTVRRVCTVLGIIGALGLFLGREAVSKFSFGNTDHAWDIGVLSVIVLSGGIMSGQTALLQGMRRIGDLARVNILGALAGAVFSIPIVYIWGREGIPAYLAMVAITGVLVSWHFARKVRVEPVAITASDITSEARSLLKLGIAFAASGLMTTGGLFLIRILVARQEGVDGAGQFQAASALSMVYIGFVLQAMGTDFYPRLAAVSEDDRRCNQLVNEQAEISMLLGLPGILGTIALAPWVLHLFYSRNFDAAAEILCWQTAGMVLRLGSWPMAFIVMAKGRPAAVFWTELAAHSTYVLLAWAGLKFFGLPGAGIAFLGLYVFHWAMMYAVVRRMTGFAWSSDNRKLAVLGLIATAVVLTARFSLSEPWATATGVVLATGIGYYCLTILAGFVGHDKIGEFLAKRGIPAGLTKLIWTPRVPIRATAD